MAQTSYSVTVEEVAAKLPIAGTISATSRPVSTSDVKGFIEDADAQMTGVLRSAGVPVDSLDDDTTRQVQEAVKSYAAAQCLSAMNVRGQLQSQFMEQWRETYERYKSRPQLLSARINRTHSNIDTSSSATTAGFVGRDYKF